MHKLVFSCTYQVKATNNHPYWLISSSALFTSTDVCVCSFLWNCTYIMTSRVYLFKSKYKEMFYDYASEGEGLLWKGLGFTTSHHLFKNIPNMHWYCDWNLKYSMVFFTNKPDITIINLSWEKFYFILYPYFIVSLLFYMHSSLFFILCFKIIIGIPDLYIEYAAIWRFYNVIPNNCANITIQLNNAENMLEEAFSKACQYLFENLTVHFTFETLAFTVTKN